MPHFQLCTIDGEELGPVEYGRPDWPPGSVIDRGDEPNLRVLDLIVSDDVETFSVLVVEPV